MSRVFSTRRDNKFLSNTNRYDIGEQTAVPVGRANPDEQIIALLRGGGGSAHREKSSASAVFFSRSMFSGGQCLRSTRSVGRSASPRPVPCLSKQLVQISQMLLNATGTAHIRRSRCTACSCATNPLRYSSCLNALPFHPPSRGLFEVKKPRAKSFNLIPAP